MSKNKYPLISLAYENNIKEQWLNRIFMMKLGEALCVNPDQKFELNQWYLQNNFFTYFFGGKA